MSLIFAFLLTSAVLIADAYPQDAIVHDEDELQAFHESVLIFINELLTTFDIYFTPVMHELEKMYPDNYGSLETDEYGNPILPVNYHDASHSEEYEHPVYWHQERHPSEHLNVIPSNTECQEN